MPRADPTDSPMLCKLTAHPDFAAPAIQSLDAEAVRLGAALALTYRLDADISALAISSPAAPTRTDDLWRRTCFEAFLKPTRGEAYLELNLAPSGAWAAYRFDAYRAGMANAEIDPPAITLEAAPNHLILRAAITLPAFVAGHCAIALTAVIEDQAGAKSYWSLAHPEGRPDFHAAANFVLSD
jgi:hypothetical protein